MDGKYIIGLDGGTQSTKIVIFDLHGNIVCAARQNLRPMFMPEPGIAEHPDDDLWDSIVTASRQVMDLFPFDPDSIIGLGLCTIRCCRAYLKEDGSLASPVLNWMDRRLARPCQEQDPQVKYVTTSSGYLTHRFTGEFKDTAANYEGMWPIDKESWQWSADATVLENYNMPREKLFDLVTPGAILGYVTEAAATATGIPAGIPVVATANDKAVEALGAGLQPGPTALVSLGTYIGGMVYGRDNIDAAKSYFSNMAAIPHHYLYESGGIRYGMSTVSWFKDLLGPGLAGESKVLGISPEETLDTEARHIAVGSDGLMTIPDWLAPPDQAFKRGMMIGFHAGHTRAHIYRSILEGIALTMKNHVDEMCGELDIVLEQILVSGGGSNGDLTMQIFADAFGVPATRNTVNEAAALGAAISVAMAAQAYDSYESAINQMVRVGQRFNPDPENTSAYQSINSRVYQNITRYTDRILSIADPAQHT